MPGSLRAEARKSGFALHLCRIVLKKAKSMEIIKLIVIGIGLSVGGVLVYGALRFNLEPKRPKVHWQKNRSRERLHNTQTA